MVLAIQRINKGLGFPAGALKARYGSGTLSGVQSFQASRGLTSDGIVGSMTWGEYREELFAITTASYPAPYNCISHWYSSPGYADHSQRHNCGTNGHRWYVKNRKFTGVPQDCDWSVGNSPKRMHRAGPDFVCYFD
ncbi:MAG: peptidoglycan-binding domain-containing protein [Acidimicrobiales bacterium]